MSRGAMDVRPDEERGSGGGPATILLDTDGSRGSDLAALTAAEYSRKFGSRLYLTHVMPVSSFYLGFGEDEVDTLTIYEEDAKRARSLLEERVRKIEDKGVVAEKADLRTGEPAAGVVAFAEEIDADLVVIGSRGTGSFGRAPIGSVSESIVRHAHCPVLVVRE